MNSSFLCLEESECHTALTTRVSYMADLTGLRRKYTLNVNVDTRRAKKYHRARTLTVPARKYQTEGETFEPCQFNWLVVLFPNSVTKQLLKTLKWQRDRKQTKWLALTNFSVAPSKTLAFVKMIISFILYEYLTAIQMSCYILLSHMSRHLNNDLQCIKITVVRGWGLKNKKKTQPFWCYYNLYLS